MYVVGERRFRTKNASYTFAKKLLTEHGTGKAKGELNNYLSDLILLHPEYNQKKGCGIDYFEVSTNEAGYFTTLINRVDGSCVPFSWFQLSNFKINTYKDNLINAMRQAISSDTEKFRETAEMICIACGSTERLQVDHIYPPFKKIRDDFWDENEESPKVFANHEVYNCAVFRDEDIDYHNKWVEYHNKKAKYQILCSTCNQRKGIKKTSVIL